MPFLYSRVNWMFSGFFVDYDDKLRHKEYFYLGYSSLFLKLFRHEDLFYGILSFYS